MKISMMSVDWQTEVSGESCGFYNSVGMQGLSVEEKEGGRLRKFQLINVSQGEKTRILPASFIVPWCFQ